jgi:hypothetical protein
MAVGHAVGHDGSHYGQPIPSGPTGHVPFRPEAYSMEERPRPPRRMIRSSSDMHEEGYHHPPPPMSTRIQSPPPTTLPPPTPVPEPMNCVSICTHVKSCPVCSQLYRPYTGIYLAVIVILIIIILFLLKKIFQF